jgi:ParB-like chromosome segregation protein Spo0J
MNDTQATLEPRTGIFVPVSLLEPHEANTKARPTEKPEARALRVESIAKSIAAQGQHYPVLVVESQSEDEFDDDGNPITTYQYVDGGARVDAIRKLDDGTEVWCSVVSSSDDLFRTAVTSNLHRTQNSILDMAYIIQEVRERHSWTGLGGQKKVCEYLGLPQNRVSDYERLLRAPKPIRDMIDSGEVATVDAALLLLKQDTGKLDEITAKAKLIAEREGKDKKAETKAKATKKLADAVLALVETPPVPDPMAEEFVAGNDGQPEPFTGATVNVETLTEIQPETPAPVPVKVTAKHVAQAAKEVTGKANVSLSRAEIVEDFEGLLGLPYPVAAKDFIEYFCDVHVKGLGTTREFTKKFDAAVGFDINALDVRPIVNIEMVREDIVIHPKQTVKPVTKKVAAEKIAWSAVNTDVDPILTGALVKRMKARQLAKKVAAERIAVKPTKDKGKGKK